MSMLGDRITDGTTPPGSDVSAGLPAPVSLDPETTMALLRIAREAVAAAATQAPRPRHESRPLTAELDEPGAAFVTITEHGLLRGCMGSLVAAVSYTHLRAHETVLDLVCRLLLEK